MQRPRILVLFSLFIDKHPNLIYAQACTIKFKIYYPQSLYSRYAAAFEGDVVLEGIFLENSMRNVSMLRLRRDAYGSGKGHARRGTFSFLLAPSPLHSFLPVLKFPQDFPSYTLNSNRLDTLHRLIQTRHPHWSHSSRLGKVLTSYHYITPSSSIFNRHC